MIKKSGVYVNEYGKWDTASLPAHLVEQFERGTTWVPGTTCPTCGHQKEGYYHYTNEAQQAKAKLDMLTQQRWERDID